MYEVSVLATLNCSYIRDKYSYVSVQLNKATIVILETIEFTDNFKGRTFP